MKNTRPWKLCFGIYCVVMLWLLFHRSGAIEGVSYWDQVKMSMNLTPFHTISNYWHILENPAYYIEKWEAAGIYWFHARTAFVNLAGNVVMFIPLGFLLPKAWKKLRAFWKVLLLTAAIIVLVETAQLFTLMGSCDVDDLILNVLGAALGYIVFKITAK